jgi:hypothetical protein
MNVSEVMEILEAEMPGCASWRVAILSRPRGGRPAEDGAVVSFPVFDVSVDHDEPEVNLVTDERAERPRPLSQALTLHGLHVRLQALVACEEYRVYSATARFPLPDGHEGRIDAPLVGVARDPDGEVFGFLQWPIEQWDEPEGAS